MADLDDEPSLPAFGLDADPVGSDAQPAAATPAKVHEKPEDIKQRVKRPSQRDQVVSFLKSRGWTDEALLASEFDKWHWRVLGTVVLLSQIPNVAELKSTLDVSDAFLSVLKGSRTVVAYLTKIKGELRRPTVQILTPNGETTTIHTENGIKFFLDVTKVMFAGGNGTERIRFSQMDAKGETVVDMFAGIGYFTIPLAKRAGPLKVIGLDKNTDSASYLRENAKLNNVEHVVTVYQGDNRLIANEWVGMCDRVLMGYLPSAEPFIERALQFAKADRAIVHYHYISKKDEALTLPQTHFAPWLEKFGRKLELLHVENVKNYAPQLCHFTADLLITGTNDATSKESE